MLGYTYDEAKWINCHIALTNIGLFLFDAEKLASAPPEVVWINELSLRKTEKGDKLEKMSYIIEILQNKQLKWTFSCPDQQKRNSWEFKIDKMIEEYQKLKGLILMPEEVKQTPSFSGINFFGVSQISSMLAMKNLKKNFSQEKELQE